MERERCKQRRERRRLEKERGLVLERCQVNEDEVEEVKDYFNYGHDLIIVIVTLVFAA